MLLRAGLHLPSHLCPAAPGLGISLLRVFFQFQEAAPPVHVPFALPPLLGQLLVLAGEGTPSPRAFARHALGGWMGCVELVLVRVYPVNSVP